MSNVALSRHAAVGSNDGLGPRWWDCTTYGRGRANAWGCPECVREMREEIKRLRAALTKIDDGLCIDPRTVAHDALWPNVALTGPLDS